MTTDPTPSTYAEKFLALMAAVRRHEGRKRERGLASHFDLDLYRQADTIAGTTPRQETYDEHRRWEQHR